MAAEMIFSDEEWCSLEMAFFSSGSVIIKGSEIYQEFLDFFNKYQSFKNRKPVVTTSESKSYFEVKGLRFPSYAPKNKLSLCVETIKPHFNKQTLFDFQEIVSMFFQFRSKKSMSKLVTLLKDRSSLPIAAYEVRLLRKPVLKYIQFVCSVKLSSKLL
jgi:hypothetical protein